jgi:lipopolysaccharide cholinephosphotransferase
VSFIIYKKEVLPWGKRRIYFFGFKYEYVSNIKKQYENLIYSLETFKSLTDITQLKKATGELRENQIQLVHFAKQTYEELKNKHIHPFLIAGSLVGLLRHKGFVPWDDDIDFALPRDQFESLKVYLKSRYYEIDNSKINVKNRKKYFIFLDSEIKKKSKKILFVNFYTHIKMIYGESIHNSVSIDFFPLDYINENANIKAYKHFSGKINSMVRKIKWVNSILINLDQYMKQSGLFSEVPTSKMYYGFDNLDATKRTHTVFYDTNTIFPLKEALFEDEVFLIPNQPEKFIKVMLNGDYFDYPSDVGLSSHRQEIRKFLD